MNKTVEYYMSLPYPMEIIPDDVEGGYAACFPDLPGCLTCAETIEDLVKEAEDAKLAWFTAALDEGIKINEPSKGGSLMDYSGQFKLRIPKSLHRTLYLNARKEGISMNQYCIYLLSRNDALHTEAKT